MYSISTTGLLVKGTQRPSIAGYDETLSSAIAAFVFVPVRKYLKCNEHISASVFGGSLLYDAGIGRLDVEKNRTGARVVVGTSKMLA